MIKKDKKGRTIQAEIWYSGISISWPWVRPRGTGRQRCSRWPPRLWQSFVGRRQTGHQVHEVLRQERPLEGWHWGPASCRWTSRIWQVQQGNCSICGGAELDSCFRIQWQSWWKKETSWLAGRLTRNGYTCEMLDNLATVTYRIPYKPYVLSLDL